MNAVLVSAAILGQCGGGICPAPGFGFGVLEGVPGGPVILGEPIYVEPAPVIVRPPAAPAVRREYRWHDITHDGLDFRVWGYLSNGTVTWEPNLPENARNWEEARPRAQRRDAASPDVSHLPAPEPAPPKAAVMPPAAGRPEGDQPVKQEVGQALNFGLAPDRLGRHTEYTADTDEARRFVAEARSEAGEAGRLHVTVIGSADDCAPVVDDIRTDPAFAALRDRLMVQDYRPDEWAVDPKLGYQTHGTPTILVQQARGPRDPEGGRVLYRAMDYSIGAEGLAEAIRDADPSYEPDKDPGPATGRGGACPLGFTRDHWPAILAAGAVLAVVFLVPSRKEPTP